LERLADGRCVLSKQLFAELAVAVDYNELDVDGGFAEATAATVQWPCGERQPDDLLVIRVRRLVGGRQTDGELASARLH
jgi:hypothetical protein